MCVCLPPGLPRGSGLRTLKARIDNLMRQLPRTEVVRRQLETQRWLYRQLLADEKENNSLMEGEEPRKRRKPAASGDGPSRKSSRLESAAATLGGSVSGHQAREILYFFISKYKYRSPEGPRAGQRPSSRRPSGRWRWRAMR
jgi:hypothetical protein